MQQSLLAKESTTQAAGITPPPNRLTSLSLSHHHGNTTRPAVSPTGRRNIEIGDADEIGGRPDQNGPVTIQRRGNSFWFTRGTITAVTRGTYAWLDMNIIAVERPVAVRADVDVAGIASRRSSEQAIIR